MKSVASRARFLTLCVAVSAQVYLSSPPHLGAQIYPGGRGIGRSGTGGSNTVPVPDAVATFEGVFKDADKKFVEIQVDDSGDTVRMYITRGTKFIRDGKTVKAADFHDGDKVTADATRDARLNLLAVKIEAKKPGDKASDEKKSDK